MRLAIIILSLYRPIRSAVASWQLEDIKHHPSYNGSMTGKKAELRLQQHGGNCYLIRYSEANSTYVLSVMKRSAEYENGLKAAHFQLNVIKGISFNEYEVRGSEKTFYDIFKLLEYYQKNPVDHSIQSIGEACPMQRDSCI